MQRYFFHIAYNGFNFRGWQKFDGIESIQQAIESALSAVLRKPVSIVGCGRTDARVNAVQFYFHVDLNPIDTEELLFKINKNLPADISVFEIIPVDVHRHARHDAVSRSYDYFIHTTRDPFLVNGSAYYDLTSFSIEKVNRAVSLLTTYNDYRGLCKNVSNYRTTLCNITEARFFESEDGTRYRFHITADRFLSGMVRILIGKFLLIGSDKLSVEEFEQILMKGEAAAEHKPAHPQGLYLSRVVYPFLDREPRTQFVKMLSFHVSDWQSVS